MSLLTDLISYWKLDEASGTRVDSVGGNDLTDNNTVTQGVGKVGNAALFIATNSEYLSHASNAALQTGDIDFTFAFWYHPINSSVVMFGKTGATNEYYGYFNGAVIQWATAGAFVDSSTVTTGAWYLVVCWHDAAADTINIQINNGTVASLPTGGTAPNVSTNPFYLGAYTGPAYFTEGRLDEFGFWKRTLTAGERTELWNGGDGTTHPFVFTQSVSIVGSGGLTVGGAASVLRGVGLVGSGGVAVGGAATIVRGAAQIGSGGVLVGGAAGVRRGLVLVASGGVLVGGTAGAYGAVTNPTPPYILAVSGETYTVAIAAEEYSLAITA